MKIRELFLIIVSVGLLSTTLYFVMQNTKLKEENLHVKKELQTYIQNAQNAKEEALQEQKDFEKAQKVKEHLALKERVKEAYLLAQALQEKYKDRKNLQLIIVEALNQKGVYVKNYAGDSVGDVQGVYLKDGLRAIALEEIQKVRRRKEGYIQLQDENSEQKEEIYVKDLEMYQLFIGASRIFR